MTPMVLVNRTFWRIMAIWFGAFAAFHGFNNPGGMLLYGVVGMVCMYRAEQLSARIRDAELLELAEAERKAGEVEDSAEEAAGSSHEEEVDAGGEGGAEGGDGDGREGGTGERTGEDPADSPEKTG